MFRKHKIRVLFAISNLTYGGIQTQAITLAKGLQNKGAKVYFIWATKAEKEFIDKELLENDFQIIDGRFIEDKSLQKYSWRLHRYLPLIRAVLLLRFYRINYVLPYQNDLSYFFGSIHKYSGAKKTIFHIRNTVIETKPKQKWQLKQALLNKPVIIANSNHARLKFKQIYGEFYDLDIHTIHNGIEVRSIDENINWKEYFGVGSVEFVVSVIANFFKEKDFITVFKAWKSFIDKTNSNAMLLIAGDEGIKGMSSYYLNQVEELGLKDSVRFLGRTPYNIELLSITSCNILSTHNEGLPNSVIETLAIGVPFLGTDVAGIKEVVGDAYPIPLFQIGDYKGLAENLIKIFNKEYNLQQIRDYSLKRYEHFKVEKLIDNYCRILEI
ncbi:MAG: hypothetical protein CMP05_00220 [Xanthomarina sp.]|uniref:glycosyltransferase family 4 protein n=1 Tax=Xanthomarina sp. TaxID=1931211 RepID=UPI000C621898|nr:glycosyltransferase family 4 protein [Xanthomarina sp.]MAL23609.1 hypothetical protein [Xanthomarina sp.]MBF60409.1 hypothetical protein [Xanthomarina sp.]